MVPSRGQDADTQGRVTREQCCEDASVPGVPRVNYKPQLPVGRRVLMFLSLANLDLFVLKVSLRGA